MRGIDLDVFEFDYDLTWMAFILAPDGTVLGRYGGRDADSTEGRMSVAGLRHALDAALAAKPAARPARKQHPRTVDDYRAAKRLRDQSCVHCHQVWDVRREDLQADKKWSLDEVWVYPLPENIGVMLDVDRGTLVREVAKDSAADRAGVRVGDRLSRVDGLRAASFADVQHALHKTAGREVTVAWVRDGKETEKRLELPDGWRKTDVSWRWSLRSLDPQPVLYGDDLEPDDRKALGLDVRRLAFRQGAYVPAAARQAGLKPGDVIVGIDGRTPEMTARQFLAHVRLTYKVGDRVTYQVLRGGKPLDITLELGKKQ